MPKPYSLDLRERLTLLRKANARTAETVTTCIGDLLHAFSPQECANYLVNSGYAST